MYIELRVYFLNMKRLIIFVVILITLVLKVVFDNNYQNLYMSNFFIDNIVSGECHKNYELLNKAMKEEYSKIQFCSIFMDVDFEKDLYYKVSRVRSSDNFTLTLLYAENTISIYFGGGWGRGWKVTKIEL